MRAAAVVQQDHRARLRGPVLLADHQPALPGGRAPVDLLHVVAGLVLPHGEELVADRRRRQGPGRPLRGVGAGGGQRRQDLDRGEHQEEALGERAVGGAGEPERVGDHRRAGADLVATALGWRHLVGDVVDPPGLDGADGEGDRPPPRLASLIGVVGGRQRPGRRLRRSDAHPGRQPGRQAGDRVRQVGGQLFDEQQRGRSAGPGPDAHLHPHQRSRVDLEGVDRPGKAGVVPAAAHDDAGGDDQRGQSEAQLEQLPHSQEPAGDQQGEVPRCQRPTPGGQQPAPTSCWGGGRGPSRSAR